MCFSEKKMKACPNRGNGCEWFLNIHSVGLNVRFICSKLKSFLVHWNLIENVCFGCDKNNITEIRKQNRSAMMLNLRQQRLNSGQKVVSTNLKTARRPLLSQAKLLTLNSSALRMGDYDSVVNRGVSGSLWL